MRTIGIALVLLALLALLSIGMAITFGFIHLIVTLAIAGLVGWLADLVVPGDLPYGWLGAVVAGVVGGWLGAALIGNVGPSIFGVQLFPTFIGAALLAAVAELLTKSAARGRR